MTVLDVFGARRYYETHGRGPLMFMVPGAAGVADSLRPVAEHLAASYTVVLYDRRGFSRSQLNGPQDSDHRLETDADDLRRLIEHLSGEPATIFGANSGGIVVLDLLARHPSVVHTPIPFEPAAVRELPNGQRWINFFHTVYDLCRQSDIEPALQQFRERAFTDIDRQVMARVPRKQANATHCIYQRIVPTAGRESRGYPAYEVNLELGKKLGRELIELPGGHVGYVTQPAEFARQLMQALARTGHRPKA